MRATLQCVDHLSDFPLGMSETVEATYRVERGRLVPFPFHCTLANWPDWRRADMLRRINSAAADGGSIIVAKAGHAIVGVASLRPLRDPKGRMQLYTIHVDQGFRQRGIGRSLFEEAERLAKREAAEGLYISAATKQNSVDFYVAMGATVSNHMIPDLLEEEPDDIHLEKMWGKRPKPVV